MADVLGAASHRTVTVDLRAIGGSALTDEIEVPKDTEPGAGGVPVTYVPARNTVLLALLLGLAEAVGAADLFIGATAGRSSSRRSSGSPRAPPWPAPSRASATACTRPCWS